jgi:cytoplasmic iron level regulating protein YaaA (DUF328/UPF0246 family)
MDKNKCPKIESQNTFPKKINEMRLVTRMVSFSFFCEKNVMIKFYIFYEKNFRDFFC